MLRDYDRKVMELISVDDFESHELAAQAAARGRAPAGERLPASPPARSPEPETMSSPPVPVVSPPEPPAAADAGVRQLRRAARRRILRGLRAAA